MKRLVVVQARMGSTRLPGKVMLPLAGRPLLERMIERLRAARAPFDLCVATTVQTEDDPIVELCREIDVDCFRGHPSDLLDRHLSAARRVSADVVVKIPSDCPLIDPTAVDRVFAAFDAAPGRYDLVTNLCPATWPDGNDVEIMLRDALEVAFREARRTLEREHTTPFLWEHPERFRVLNVRWETGLDYSRSHRLTIDYAEDYRLIRALFEELYEPNRVFSLSELLDLMQRKPELLQLNARWVGSSWQQKHAAELRTFAPNPSS